MKYFGAFSIAASCLMFAPILLETGLDQPAIWAIATFSNFVTGIRCLMED